MESSTTERRAVGAATIAEAFRITAAERADQVAVRTRGRRAVRGPGAHLRERVDALAGGLDDARAGQGRHAALLIANRPEFHLCDLAAMMVGATPFSIYMQYTPEQIQYVVSDAGARDRRSPSSSSWPACWRRASSCRTSSTWS